MAYILIAHSEEDNNKLPQGGVISNDEMIINGERIPIPEFDFRNVSIVRDKVYVDGWEYKGNGKWSRTFKAFWYKYF